MAWRARLFSLLWQAIGALSNILNALGECHAAARLLMAVLPRCLETDNVYVIATLYSLLADAYMGHAGSAQDGRRVEFFTKAHGALDSAFKYFSAVEDVEKQCEVLAKQAVIMRVNGDVTRADDYAARYMVLKRDLETRNR